jgi:hypothetical protein
VKRTTALSEHAAFQRGPAVASPVKSLM